jgi:FkbM family methyltransferase
MRHPGGSGTYRDSFGYLRRADLSDPIEALAFVGVDHGLPQGALDCVSSGDVVLDAGANVGTVTAQLCHRVGQEGTVIAVEPLPANVSRLEALKTDNDLRQLEIVQAALWDERGEIELKFPEKADRTSPYGSITASWIDGGTVKVPTLTLDELIPSGPGRRVSLIKLDVECAEPSVLSGAKRLLAEHRPAIYCEFNDIVLRDCGFSADRLLDRFIEIGYEVSARDVVRSRRLTGDVTDLLLLPGDRID